MLQPRAPIWLWFLLVAAVGGYAQQPSSEESIGEVYASDASVQGSLIYSSSGAHLLSGSTVEAGASAAMVHLDRGGQVRVCPGTSVAIRATRSGPAGGAQHLLLSLDTGALETEYSLGASADSIVTPDFRILLAGPGEFHLAVGADARGNACLRALPGNNAAALVTEMMGDGSYQLKSNGAVSFRGGRVVDFSSAAAACGCPAPAPSHGLQIADTPAPAPPPAPPALAATPDVAANLPAASSSQPASVSSASAENSIPAEAPASALAGTASETRPVPPSAPGEVHVEVEAPFVFRAAAPGPEPELLAQLRVPTLALPPPQVLPPPVSASQKVTAPKPKRHGVFGHLLGVLASMFGH